jgi:hypothetical protein
MALIPTALTACSSGGGGGGGGGGGATCTMTLTGGVTGQFPCFASEAHVTSTPPDLYYVISVAIPQPVTPLKSADAFQIKSSVGPTGIFGFPGHGALSGSGSVTTTDGGSWSASDDGQGMTIGALKIQIDQATVHDAIGVTTYHVSGAADATLVHSMGTPGGGDIMVHADFTQ